MSAFSYDPRTGSPKRRRARFSRTFAPGGGPRLPWEDISAIDGGSYPTGQIGSPMSPTGPGSSYKDLLTIPGTQPDFAKLLGADPLLSQFRRGLGAESIADDASRDAAIRRTLISFGSIPEGQEFAEYGDPETRSLSELNTQEGLSLLARLNREHGRGSQNIADALAARGALRSGAHGIAQRNLQQDFKQSLSSAEGDMLDYIAGIQRAFTDAERARFRDLAAAQTEAAGRPPEQAAGTPTEEAVLIGFTPEGKPVYEGKNSKKRFLDPQTPWDGEVLPNPPEPVQPEPVQPEPVQPPKVTPPPFAPPPGPIIPPEGDWPGGPAPVLPPVGPTLPQPPSPPWVPPPPPPWTPPSPGPGYHSPLGLPTPIIDLLLAILRGGGGHRTF